MLGGEGTALLLPGWLRPTLPLGLCHLRERNARSFSPHSSQSPALYSCCPVLNQTPSSEAAVPQPNADSRAAELAQEHDLCASHLPAAAEGLHCSPFSFPLPLPCQGSVSCARAPFGPADPTGTRFQQPAIPAAGSIPALSCSQIRGEERWQPTSRTP